MKLYLVRHGQAADAADETGERPLSARGRSDIAAQAAFLAGAGVTVDRVFHSGKLRARQTAEIIAAKIAADAPVAAMKHLAPMDDPDPLARAAEIWAAAGLDTLVAGHNPFLERLTTRWLCGDEGQAVLVKTGTVLCFECARPGHWRLNWLVAAELTRAR